MKKEEEIQSGLYRHFKGGYYHVLDVGTDSETLQKVVIYQSAKDKQLWVRPSKMFLETVDFEGKEMPRFKYIGDK